MRRFPLFVLLAISMTVSACSGGGGGAGDDDDDDAPPPPARPGWIALRFKSTPVVDQTFWVGIADGSLPVAEVNAPPGGRSFVDFSDPSAAAGDERVVMKVATSATAGDLYVANVDGTGEQLLATGVSGVHGWADATHLVVRKGKGPTESVTPNRDLYMVPLDATGEIALTTNAADEDFAGIANGNVVFRRGPLIGESSLVAIPALGGAEVPLTTEPGSESFFGFTASNRVVYTNNQGANQDLFTVPLSGTGRITLADTASAEVPYAIRGERVVFVENIEVAPGTFDGNVFSVNADGTSLVELSVTADLPENPVGITAGGQVLITQQTSPDPVEADLLSVPIAGGSPVVLGPLLDGGIDAIIGERVVFHRGTPNTLFAIDAGGGAETTLAEDATFMTATTTRVLFSRMDGADEKIWTVPLGGGTDRKLRDEPGADQLKAALGNIVVLSVTGAGGAEDLVAVDSSGSNLRTLAGETDAEQFRAITPDGRVIFSKSRGQFLDDLYIVNADGTALVTITDRPDADVFLGFLP